MLPLLAAGIMLLPGVLLPGAAPAPACPGKVVPGRVVGAPVPAAGGCTGLVVVWEGSVLPGSVLGAAPPARPPDPAITCAGDVAGLPALPPGDAANLPVPSPEPHAHALLLTKPSQITAEIRLSISASQTPDVHYSES